MGVYVLKLSMIMQVLLDPATDQIGEEAVRSAHAIVEYAIRSTLHLFKSHFELPKTAKVEQKVVDYIAKKGGTILRHALQSSRILDGGSKVYDDVITSLIDQGKILETEDESNKRYNRYTLTEIK